jgi:hypothetical protein
LTFGETSAVRRVETSRIVLNVFFEKRGGGAVREAREEREREREREKERE